MASSWKSLNLSLADTNLPPLLVKYDFGPFHYNVFLTDLTSIWAESLERKQIVKRALILDTSIDPSENNEQLQLLLRNIQRALDGVDTTKLSLSRGKDLDQLDLSTTSPLPAPLKPLKWPFHLDPAPRDILTVELLLPCLSQLSTANAQIASLLRQLKGKDHVITRLTDKMQADGTDISKVFPGAAGIKIGTRQNVREIAGKSVKGLKLFDETEWRNEFIKISGLSFNLPDVLSQVFAPGLSDAPEIKPPIGSETWWHHLRQEEYQATKAATTVLPQPPQPSLKSESSDTNDGEFQRQVAPARLRFLACDDGKSSTNDMRKIQRVTGTSSPENGDTTTDDDSDAEASSRNPHDSPPISSSRHSSAPTFGSKSLSSDRLDLNLVDRPTNAQGQAEPTKNTTPESSKSDPDHQNGVLNEVLSPKLKPRLGRIGGKTKSNKDGETQNQNPILERIPLHVSSEVDTIQVEGSKHHPLFPEALEPSRTGRTSVRLKSPSVPRETSQERANNKREILKRELESKSNARAKKKRKF